jgi:N-acetyl-alpha-D-glucosaminyl L-malate synthase BshA
LVAHSPDFFQTVRYAIEASDRVTCVSRTLWTQTRERMGIRRPIDIIPNFVDTNRFHPRRRRNRNPVLIHVSNLRPVKRIRDTLRVHALVRKHVPAELWVVGEGPELAVAQAEAGEGVRFLGARRNVSDLIARADAMLVTSERESFGLTALEAMACGVPVVSTRCGGVEELLEDRAGLFADVGDTRGLARQVERLVRHPALADSLGRAGREIALAKYDRTAVVSRYEKIYASLAPGKRRN